MGRCLVNDEFRSGMYLAVRYFGWPFGCVGHGLILCAFV